MSDKRKVPTFRVFINRRNQEGNEVNYHGPIVSPDKMVVATTLSEVHDICTRFQSFLIYDRKWHLVNWSYIVEVQKGSQFFPLPWPLRDQSETQNDGGENA